MSFTYLEVHSTDTSQINRVGYFDDILLKKSALFF